jgi:hypothetical protein
MMNTRVMTVSLALALSALDTAPALALNDPLVFTVHRGQTTSDAASATIFGSRGSVLVNVIFSQAVPPRAAMSLNDGSCANPGNIAFALSAAGSDGSLTRLKHSLASVAGRAKSLVIHRTSSMTSPAFACGNVRG